MTRVERRRALTFRKLGTLMLRNIFLKAPGSVPSWPSACVSCSSIALTLAATIFTKVCRCKHDVTAEQTHKSILAMFQRFPQAKGLSERSFDYLGIKLLGTLASHFGHRSGRANIITHLQLIDPSVYLSHFVGLLLDLR